MFFTIEHFQAEKSHVWQSFYFKLNILFEYCRIFSIIFFLCGKTSFCGFQKLFTSYRIGELPNDLINIVHSNIYLIDGFSTPCLFFPSYVYVFFLSVALSINSSATISMVNRIACLI